MSETFAQEVQDVLASVTKGIGAAIKLAENPNVEAAVAKIIPAIKELATPGEQIAGILSMGSAILTGIFGMVGDNNPTFKVIIGDIEDFIGTIVKDLTALIPAGDAQAAQDNTGKLG
jgi:hypothetical protein